MNSGLLRRLFLTRRSNALLLLGCAAGLPYVVATSTLQGWLTAKDFSELEIGQLSWLLLPFALKVLWAPLADALMPPGPRGWGRRRRWMLLSQLAVIAALLGFALVAGFSERGGLFALVIIVGLAMTMSAATHDVSADAYRTDVSPPETRAAAASVYVTGYRAALALWGAGSLIVGERCGWGWAFIGLAVAMAASSLGTWLAPEPPHDHPDDLPLRARLESSIRAPLVDFSRRWGARALLLALFVFVYRLPDNLALPMTIPFLNKHLGYDMETIGLVRQAVGLGVTIGGALLGGVLVPILGMRRSLFVFGATQALSTASFAFLAMYAQAIHPAPPGWVALALAVVVEYLGVGVVTAGFVAFLMSVCTAKYSATQYALLTAVMVLGAAFAGDVGGRCVQALRGAMGGASADGTMWSIFFLICVASGALGMILVPFVARPDEER